MTDLDKMRRERIARWYNEAGDRICYYREGTVALFIDNVCTIIGRRESLGIAEEFAVANDFKREVEL